MSDYVTIKVRWQGGSSSWQGTPEQAVIDKELCLLCTRVNEFGGSIMYDGPADMFTQIASQYRYIRWQRR